MNRTSTRPLALVLLLLGACASPVAELDLPLDQDLELPGEEQQEALPPAEEPAEAVACQDWEVRWTVPTGLDQIDDMSASLDGRVLLHAADGSVQLWSWDARRRGGAERLRSFPAADFARIDSLGDEVVAVDAEGTLKVHGVDDARGARWAVQLPAEEGVVSMGVLASRFDQTIAVQSNKWGSWLRTFDTAEGADGEWLWTQVSDIEGLEVVARGDGLVTFGDSWGWPTVEARSLARPWDFTAGWTWWSPSQAPVRAVASNADGSRMIAASDDNLALIGMPEHGAPFCGTYGMEAPTAGQRRLHSHHPVDVAVIDEADLAATLGAEGSVRLWSMEDLSEVSRLRVAAPTSLVAVGESLLVGSADGSLSLIGCAG